MRLPAQLLAALVLCIGSSAACAHASLVGSDPPDRAMVAQAPVQVRLTFNEPVSPLAIRLVRPSGDVTDLTTMAVTEGDAIVVALPPLSAAIGAHLVSWRVVSADGHPVGGTIAFSVGQPGVSPAMPELSDPALRAAIWLTRLVLYIGMFIGAGGVFFAAWIARAPPVGPGRAMAVGLLGAGLAAAIASFGLHGADLLGEGLAASVRLRSWQAGLASPQGWTLGVAAVSLGLALAALASPARAARWWSAASLAGIGAALALSGHAVTAGPDIVTRSALFLHAVCVAFWVGALPPLAASVASNRDTTALARFSAAIPLPLAILIASGALLAIFQVRRVDALWATAYGLVLSLKLAAVCALLILAALNRRSTPRVLSQDPRAARRLRRSIVTEIVIVLAILGLVASWRFTPPPRALQAAAGRTIQAHIHTDRAMADLEIAPVRPGSWRIRITLMDGQFRPLTAKEIALVLTKPDAGLEPLRIPAVLKDGTTWETGDILLPLGGRWQVRADILVSDFESISVEDAVELPR
jgi:copper transport protein